MILDCNLISYEYYNNQYTPKPIRKSGAKDDDVAEDKYSFNNSDAALLVLDEDIINAQGYGLKKGFYSVIPDKYGDFLILYQSGKIKAKIPIKTTNIIEPLNPTQFKPKKMSYKKFQKQQEKEYRKYLNGTNPSEIDIKTAQILRLDEANSWIVIYNTKNIEYSGIIKF